MPAQPGPRPDQLAQRNAAPGSVLTAGSITAPDPLAVPSYASGGGGGIARQETITTETIVGVDQILTAKLSFVPLSDGSLLLLLNGVAQIQGIGMDYIITGTDGLSILWLASSGTAADLAGIDTLLAYYQSSL